MEKQAFKEATNMYPTDKPKHNCKSAKQVLNIINGKYGTSARKRTVQELVSAKGLYYRN